jgi:hypothetical protein
VFHSIRCSYFWYFEYLDTKGEAENGLIAGSVPGIADFLTIFAKYLTFQKSLDRGTW